MKMFICFFIALLSFTGCKKYLAEKPDKKLQLLETVEAVQGLLDFETTMNLQNPSAGEISADNYYVTDATFNGLSSEALRNTYLWLNDITLGEYPNQWSRLYDVVTISNVCLESLDKIDPLSAGQVSWNNARGAALLYRAKSFLSGVCCWSKAYNKISSAFDMGIPLRLNSDYEVKSTRASVQACYDQVIKDLKEATLLLPAVPKHVMRPSLPAALGLLARTYLFMNNYDSAGYYAEKYLAMNNGLMNYNSLSVTATNPFPLFNVEVVMHTIMLTPNIMGNTRAVIDSNLYRSYDTNDLRKSLFFRSNGNGTYGFRGSYSQSATLFNGVTTDEIILIKAECLAREGKVNEAMTALNNLLVTRWRTGTFIPLTAVNKPDALKTILNERRKQLIFRDIRWMDLKRLNLESEFQTTLYRKINGKDYSLLPNDNKYALPIPFAVIAMTGMEQNPR